MIKIEILDEEGGTSDQSQTGSQIPTEYVVNEAETSSDDEGETKPDHDQVPPPVIRTADVETSDGGGDHQPQSGSQVPPEALQIVIVQPPRPWGWRPRRRIFHKVPRLLLTEEKNKQDYIPKVVSIGPYHHGKSELSLAEAFKPTALDLFVLGGGRTRRFYYDKVFEVIGQIRSSYDEDCTRAYSDSKLARMMLLDACFTIIYIEMGTPPAEGESEMHEHEQRLKIQKMLTVVQDLGLLTSAIVLRDLFLLENQIPLPILKLLIDLRYGEGAGEKLLNRFLNGTLFGVYEPIRRLPLEHGGEPLHLLEAYRRVVVSDWIEPEQQHRLCHECRWLRFFRVERQPRSSPPINPEPRVNPSGSSDLEAGMDPTTNADPATAGVKCRCLCWKQCCPCFKCRWLCCFRVDQQPPASPLVNAETSVDRSTSTADQSIGAAPVTNIDPSATRRGSRLSNLRSRISLRRGVDRETSKVGPGRDVRKELHSFRSVMDLKAKGIKVEPSSSQSLKDVEFKSGFFCKQLKLPTWFVSIYTKIFFMNMIAFELSPNNFNNHIVTSYINLMKSLIESPEDVKELREKKILFNLLGSDEQVLKVYKDIETYGADNPHIFRDVKDKIQAHYNSKMKTWIGELIHTHFRTPWTVIGLVAAISLLAIASANLYYAAHDRK